MANIAVDLSSPVAYIAGEELALEVTVIAPEAATFYLLGALYDSSYNYISNSMFGIILPTGETDYVNVEGETQLLVLTAAEVKVIDCKLTFNRSSMIMGIFLMKLNGSDVSLEDDENMGSISLILTGDTPSGVSFDLSTIMMMIVVVGMMGMAMKSMVGGK